MQKLAVVYFPQLNVNEIQKFREMYDPSWRIIAPHITIVSPVSDISEDQLIQHIESTITDIESFSIHLTGLTKTLDDCLFLLVKEGNERIVNLHDRLYSGILASYRPTDFQFAPHITLGVFRTNDHTFDEKLYMKAYAEAQDLNFDMICAFDSVLVIKGDGVTPARIVKTIHLHS